MSQFRIQKAFDLAVQQHQAGRLREAERLYRQILVQQPDHAGAIHHLGVIAHQVGRNDIAVNLISQAIGLGAYSAEAHNSLGIALKEIGRPDEAIAACRQAIALNPNVVEAHVNLGNALKDKGRLDEAIAAFRQAIALNPNFAAAYNNYGVALKDKGRLDEAVAAFRQATALTPDLAEVHGNLGVALKDMGQIDSAVSSYRQAIAIRPDYFEAHSNLVYLLHFHPAYNAQTIAQEHRQWNRQHAESLRQFSQSPSASPGWHFRNDPLPDRRLRIGYVSPDFRDHVVGRNLLPLFHHHDRRQYEITCYGQVSCPDALTSDFQQNADRWRNVLGLTDDQVAEQIREDRIDILVDLTLHLANHRLLVFARKPAPVQVTFAGYPGSTGLSTVDYRLSDPYLDPPGMDESVYSEKTIRLPDSFWCYDPLQGREMSVNSLPALASSVVTFGCLGNFCKVNDSVLSLWAQVLRQVENSRLLLLAHQGSHRQRTVDRLCREGIDPGRVEFVPPQPRPQYLQLYHQIDVGLDSFPYNGHTTSLDSFWMGVPVVTLVGERAVSRAGWCQLSNLGLSELAGETPGQFVQIAVALARDLPRLKDLRSTLRQRMEQSPLLDAPKFARSIESAYRQMWRTWCKTACGKG